MSIERTFSMIKPDSVRKNVIGQINSMIEKAGFKIIAQKMIHLTMRQAEHFYDIHKDRPFYSDLCNFLSSGPVVAQVLSKDNAVSDYRKLLGSTNPLEAEEGTIRKAYGESIDYNAAHGSDSPETALREISFFFNNLEIFDI